jgi:hypothetical protein
MNEYNVFIMNNTLFIIKNGLVLNKIHNFTPEEIIVIFKSSTKTLWIILNGRSTRKTKVVILIYSHVLQSVEMKKIEDRVILSIQIVGNMKTSLRNTLKVIIIT